MAYSYLERSVSHPISTPPQVVQLGWSTEYTGGINVIQHLGIGGATVEVKGGGAGRSANLGESKENEEQVHAIEYDRNHLVWL